MEGRGFPGSRANQGCLMRSSLIRCRFHLFIACLFVSGLARADLLWQDNSVSVLYGQGYAVTEDDAWVFTLEHASGHSWGDLFLFIDTIEFEDDTADTYGELKPRLSLGKTSGKSFAFGPVSDVLLAFEWHKGEGPVEAYNTGISFDLAVPGSNYFTLGVFHRNDRHVSGHTVMVTSAWAFPFSIGRTQWLLDGFIDWIDNEGRLHSNTLFVPQLKLDVGDLFGTPKRLYAGIEYSHWDDKFGLEGIPGLDTDEQVVQALVKLHF